MTKHIGLEGIRLEVSEIKVHEDYPAGSTGYMLLVGERTYLGSIIELPCGNWMPHIPNGLECEDSNEAIDAILTYRKLHSA